MMSILRCFILLVAVSLSHGADWQYFKTHHKALPKPDLRIIGGNETVPHAYPFQVGLMIDGMSFCGGSLISNNYVLTAAHCAVAISSSVEVILGAHQIKANESTQVEIKGGEIIIHENYNRTSYENDIALIKLASPVTLNEVIKTVSLPTKEDANRKFTNDKVKSIGWGLTHDVPNPGIDDISNVLMAVTLTVSSLEDCMDYNDNPYNIKYVTEKNICTSGYKNKGTCQGDSGSPLMYQDRQIGIVSIGPTQCEACLPSVFTHVGKFLEWIAANSDVKL